MSAVAPFDDDDALPTFSGRAWALGLRLTTSDILAERDAQADVTMARRRLFADLDPTLAERLEPGDVLVADAYGGTRETVGPAMAALATAGILALVARQVAPIVAASAIEHGLLVVLLDAPTFIRTGDRLRLDFAAAKVVDLSSGDRAAIRNLDDQTRALVRSVQDRRQGG